MRHQSQWGNQCGFHRGRVESALKDESYSSMCGAKERQLNQKLNRKALEMAEDKTMQGDQEAVCSESSKEGKTK